MSDKDSISLDAINYIVKQIKLLLSYKKELCLVIGAGNLYRGAQNSHTGVSRPLSDNIGMLATTMNVLALQNILQQENIITTAYNAFNIHGIIDEFNLNQVKKDLTNKKVVLLSGGLGQPFFTTDTAAVLRALQIEADVVLKATKINGVYDKNPHQCSDAIHYKYLSYEDVLNYKCQIMDETAFVLSRDHNMPLVIFDFFSQDALSSLLKGEIKGTLVNNTRFIQDVKKGDTND